MGKRTCSVSLDAEVKTWNFQKRALNSKCLVHQFSLRPSSL